MIKRIKNKIYRLLRLILRYNNDLKIEIERSWSTDTAIGIKGWVMTTTQGALDEMEVTVNNVTTPVTSWHEAPDMRSGSPDALSSVKRGFWVQIPRIAHHNATFKVMQAGKTRVRKVTFTGSVPHPPTEYPSGENVFSDFVRRVNEEHLHVLEIGSRIVSPGSNSQRSIFPQAASYTGFDYYSDSNTDVVGDAHELSSYFDGRKFDAVFSIAVFEHLAMPWVVAMEINKVLKLGGITCHEIPFAWPAHERPWDFWRCSDAGLKVLFSQAMGFETIDAGMYAPLRMHFDQLREKQEGFAEVPCFGSSSILTRKVAEVDSEKFRWNVKRVDVLGADSHYPPRTE